MDNDLERVIGDACYAKWGDGKWGSATEQVECQAAAVRTFLAAEADRLNAKSAGKD